MPGGGGFAGGGVCGYLSLSIHILTILEVSLSQEVPAHGAGILGLSSYAEGTRRILIMQGVEGGKEGGGRLSATVPGNDGV
jgi:hypothetical protein